MMICIHWQVSVRTTDASTRKSVSQTDHLEFGGKISSRQANNGTAAMVLLRQLSNQAAVRLSRAQCITPSLAVQ